MGISSRTSVVSTLEVRPESVRSLEVKSLIEDCLALPAVGIRLGQADVGLTTA
jgi:hypothetical protein